METNISDESCPVRKTMKLLGGKWTMVILFQLNNRTLRYGELKRAIPGISEKMLISELKFLCENKLVSKKQYAEIPPKVEYKLTDFGKKTVPLMDELAKFGLGYL